NGPVVERSRSLGTRDLPRSHAPLGRPLLRDLTPPDGRHGRQVEISFRPRSEALEVAEEEGNEQGTRPAPSDPDAGGPLATLAVAHGREELDALLSSMQVALTLVVLALLGGTTLLVKSVV